jgi:hypothetical protein
MFIVVLIVMCYLGLETIARFSKLLAYVLLAGFILIIIFGIKNYDINNVFPFGAMISSDFNKRIKRSSAYGELMIIFVIAKSLQEKSIKKSGHFIVNIVRFYYSHIPAVIFTDISYLCGQESQRPFIFHLNH